MLENTLKILMKYRNKYITHCFYDYKLKKTKYFFQLEKRYISKIEDDIYVTYFWNIGKIFYKFRKYEDKYDQQNN